MRCPKSASFMFQKILNHRRTQLAYGTRVHYYARVQFVERASPDIVTLLLNIVAHITKDYSIRAKCYQCYNVKLSF